jgi:hypothetical protein
MRLPLLLTLCTATLAFAIPVGSELYIKTKDTPLLKDAKPQAPALVKLQPGTAVIWLGVSEKDKAFHQVEVGGKKGFVLRSNLSPNKPQQELDSGSGKPMSVQAFASSGAATKSPPPTTRNYNGPAEAEAAAELIYVEELNKAKATPEALTKKDKELHGR